MVLIRINQLVIWAAQALPQLGARGGGWSLQPGRVGRGRGVQGRSTFNGQELPKSFKIGECSPPRLRGVPSARTRAPRQQGSPPIRAYEETFRPRLHLTPHRPSTPPHARQAARPAPARPGRRGPRGGGAHQSKGYRNWGGGRRVRETRGKPWVGAHSLLPGPETPVPAARAFRSTREPSGPRTVRSLGAAVPPGRPPPPGAPKGASGRPGRGRRGDPARGLTGAPLRPTPLLRPAQAASLAPLRPWQDPRPPTLRGDPWAPPSPPQPPSSRHRTGLSHPFILRPGPGAGRRIPGLTQEGRAAGAAQEEAAASYSTTTGTART
ncbi:basic salivary proline-rich protein 2-like [Erinaceus europaeus]|uniref:Basic salivary proline-rich protein 2-like n=1 Tax=Erinaceus europaeus TaxID=9365 RepID=A0ABM3XKN9_ERIEU|nr:basic salivary proline-rich protein 2-like [Erinaceus europaeus]